MANGVVAVPLVYENKLAVVDAASGDVVKQIGVGIAPFAAVIDRKGAVAYVSNLGGRPPKPNELYASPMQKQRGEESSWMRAASRPPVP